MQEYRLSCCPNAVYDASWLQALRKREEAEQARAKHDRLNKVWLAVTGGVLMGYLAYSGALFTSLLLWDLEEDDDNYAADDGEYE